VARCPDKEVILGVAGPDMTADDTPRILAATLGTGFKFMRMARLLRTGR
jgi:hypothetical protein